jgi:hypothetical protein
VDKVNEERSKRGLEKYKGRVALHLPHYDLISCLSALESQVFVGVLAKPFHCWFGFSGAICTLARRGKSIRDFHWSFICWFDLSFCSSSGF